MTLEALKQTVLDTRRPLAMLDLFPPHSPSEESELPRGLYQRVLNRIQLPAFAIGFAGLCGLALQNMGYLPLAQPLSLAFLAPAAFALAIAFAAGRQRETAATELPALSLGSPGEAIAAAGGTALRWALVDGGLTWSGDTVALFQHGQTPANFRDLRPFLHPDDSLYASVSDALKASARHVCWTVRLKDGDQGWKAWRLQGAISSGHGSQEPVFNGILMPLDMQDAALRAPQGSLTRLSPIVEALPMSFAVWDTQKRLQFSNRKFRQLYRLPPGAALPGTPFDHVQAQAKEQIAQSPAGAGAAPGRFQLREQQLPDGTWLQIYEYWTGDGTMVSVGTDITVPKLSEQRILERERELRVTVESYEQSRRQLEIQAHQLRELAESYNEEKIRAEAANRAKSEFLANVSHELRTPLNAIIGFSEMMRDGVLGPVGNAKYESYANDINSSGRYLLDMINDILDMSKIEAGRFMLSPELISLDGLFDECLRVVHPAALERSVQLLQGGNANMPVFADKRALKQILINLLSNAVKFTLPGGKVLLRAYRYRGSVRIAISDTGVGIAKHELERLGRPFEQVQNQLTKGHKGTGLGLAISRSLAELHGGRLDIKSKAGEGTTVTCVLPAPEDKTLSREAA